MSIANAKVEVEAPTITPHARGVKSVATVLDVSADSHQLLGVEYLSDACAEGGTWADLCQAVDGVFCGSSAAPALVKSFDGIDIIEGEPTSIYAGLECGNAAHDQSRLDRRHGLVEGFYLDEHVYDVISAGVVDLTPTPGTAVPVIEAVGILEDFAAGVYWGQPTILAFQSTVVCADAAGVFHHDALQAGIHTLNGSKVGNLHTPSGGIPDPKHLIITGEIVVRRGPLVYFSTPETQRPDGTCDPARELAERVYVPTIDCLAARVEVDC